MSDNLAAAAAALGAPEDLTNRSAAARAAADGTSTEEVLAAWAGGAPLPAASAPPPAAETPPPTPAPSIGEVEEVAAQPAIAVAEVPAPVASAPAVAPSGSTMPILDDQRARPVSVLVAIMGLFAIGLLTALIIPSYTGGNYNHLVPDAELSATGEAGLDVYLSEGCWYCHTQMVRPILADVGLGPATETFADSLDTAAFGIQRIGPDLAHVGSRTSLMGGDEPITESEFAGVLTDPASVNPDGLHPNYSYLSESDLAALATYLLELK